MSLSWPERLHIAERLHIGLAPGRIALSRYTGWRRGCVERREVAVGTGSGTPAWLAAVEALVAELAARRGARCDVVLSNHFCRYAVLPAQPDLASEVEVAAYARLQFEAIYGAAVVADWDVRVAAGTSDTARLACAIDAALLEALRVVCADHGVLLRSVQPLFAHAFDAARRRLATGSFWFAVAEEGRLCLGALHDRRWIDVISERVQGEAAVAAQDLVDRAVLRLPAMSGASLHWHDSDVTGTRAKGVLAQPARAAVREPAFREAA